MPLRFISEYHFWINSWTEIADFVTIFVRDQATPER
jgi:hypothetical protein